jgi:hypothetical protein
MLAITSWERRGPGKDKKESGVRDKEIEDQAKIEKRRRTEEAQQNIGGISKSGGVAGAQHCSQGS